jgi:hypothetical protein
VFKLQLKACVPLTIATYQWYTLASPTTASNESTEFPRKKVQVHSLNSILPNRGYHTKKVRSERVYGYEKKRLSCVGLCSTASGPMKTSCGSTYSLEEPNPPPLPPN